MDSVAPMVEFLARTLSYFGVFLSSLAAMLLLTAAAPGFIRRERKAARAGMRRCFLWGAVFAINCVLLAALLALVDGAVGNVLALGILVGMLVISLAGLAAIATEVGQRVLGLAERYNASVFLRLVTGTTILFATAVIPVMGWVVFTGALLTGIGAFLETAVEDYRPTKRPLATPEVQPERAR
ncbi:MAG: hypothetical protein ACI9OJ_000654 [Myxococcota bacterium]|jgi:hypothetical protein